MNDKKKKNIKITIIKHTHARSLVEVVPKSQRACPKRRIKKKKMQIVKQS